MAPPKKDKPKILKKKGPKSKAPRLRPPEAFSGMDPELFRDLLGTIPIPLFFRSISGEYIGCNPAFERFLGKSRSEIIGKNNYDFFPKVLADKEIENDQEIVLSRKTQRYEWHLDKPMGGMQNVYLDKAPVMDKNDIIIGIAGAITDISDVRGLDEKMIHNANRLEALLSALPVAIVVIDFQTEEIIDLNPLAMVMLGYTREQLIGRKCKSYICGGKTGQCPLVVDPSMLLDRSEGNVTDSTGKNIPVLKSTILTEIDNRKLLLECFLDISEQKALEYQLREIAEMDFLTGIYNRRHFIESAEREIARSKRYKSMMTVAILDIDWFKEINDQFGHAAGDEVIKGVAENCRETIRGTDILGRIGGEEFAMILIETDLEDSFTVAERLRKRIESHVFKFDGQTTRCTVSIGISAIFPEKDDLETIMKRADAALYEAKQSGRNRTCRG